MTKRIICILFIFSILSVLVQAQENNGNGAKVDSSYVIDEVVVTGARNETDARLLPVTITVVNRKQIDQRYEQSLLPLLNEQVPGFFSTSRGIMGYGVSTGSAGAMSLRGIGGSPTTRLLVLIDGHPQYMGLMGHPLADAYQSMLAEKVEVVRGPASVLYGSNAMGGVVNVVTQKQRNDGVTNSMQVGYGSFNTLTSEFANSVRYKKLSSVVTASYNRSDGHRENMDFEQYGGYLKLGYAASKVWNTYADINLTHYNASNPGTVTSPLIDNDSRVTRGMSSFSIENKYDKTSGAFSLFYNWGQHEINDGYLAGNEPPAYRFHSTDNMFGLNWYQTTALFNGNKTTVGVDYQGFGGEAWNQSASVKTELANKSVDEMAAYLDFRQSLNDYLTFDAGGRIDHHSVTGTEWIPQLGLSANLPKAIELKAMMGKGFRNPTIRELYMFGAQNPNLLPERLMNYEVSYTQHLFNNAFVYGLNLFCINGNNMIQTVYVDGKPKNINTGKIENKGFELSARYRIDSHWSASANYSWLTMKHPVVAAPEHKLYVDVGYTQPKWSVTTSVQYICGLYTSVDPDVKENFLLCNARAGYQINSAVKLFVSGENLLSQHYQINAGYPMPEATVLGGINLKF
jgi:outer membrane cobalamin receptor